MIYWVMGGTAVGKKRFIERAVCEETRPEFMPPSLVAEWVNDGPCQADIVTLSRRCDVILRWQWTREEHIPNMLRDFPDIKHTLIVLTVNLMSQLSRVALREGFLRWHAGALVGELRDLYELVTHLACTYALPVMYVDSSGDNYQLRRSIA